MSIGGIELEALAADNMLRTKLPNGVSIEGLEEMVQPFNLSNQINPVSKFFSLETRSLRTFVSFGFHFLI